MFEIRATASAERDLVEIRDYLLNELCNPLAVEHLLASIRKAYEVLTLTPEAFPECTDSRLRRMGCRKCVLKGYLFIYRVEAEAGIVRVIRFFHGMQNYVAQL